MGRINVHSPHRMCQISCAMYTLTPLTYKTYGEWCYFWSHFIHKETEAQGGEAHSQQIQNWDLNLGSLAPVDTF